MRDGELGYGLYQSEGWEAASLATFQDLGLCRVEESRFEICTWPGAFGGRILFPLGVGRTNGLYSGPQCCSIREIRDEVLAVASATDADMIVLPGLFRGHAEELRERFRTVSGWNVHASRDGVASIQVADADGDFLARVPKSERKPLKRRLRQIDAVTGLETRVLTSHSDLERHFPTFVRLHAQEWRTRGSAGHYGDWPQAELFHRHLLGRTANSHGVIAGIWNNDVPVAMQFGLVCGQWASAVNLARNPDHREWDNLSPAHAAFFAFAAYAGECGARQIELGRGSYDYKRRMGATECELARLIVHRDSIRSEVLSRILPAVGWILDFGYYRIWFRRIRRYASVNNRPLSRLWRLRP